MTPTATGSISTKHFKINLQAPSQRTIGASSGIPSDVSRPKTNNKDPEEEQSKNVLGEKGSRSCKYIMIYDPASNEYETQARSLSTINRKFTNRPKVTKVESNIHAAAVIMILPWTSSYLFWIFWRTPNSQNVPGEKGSKSCIKISFVTLPRTSIHSRAFSSNNK